MKIYFLLLLILTCTFSQAQKLPSIQLDRPDQTECPYIVPAKHFQAEIGFIYQKTNAQSHSLMLPTALWKYGINKNTELRLITELEANKINNYKSDLDLLPIKIGFKTKICEEKGIIPKTSFIGHLSLPILSGTKSNSNYYAPSFRFVMQNTLSKKISLGYNLGVEWDEETKSPVYLYTLTTGYSISEFIGSYIEIFGNSSTENLAEHNIDGGFTFLLRNNIMLDISTGFGLTPTAPKFYMAIGFSFRLPN